MLKKITITIFFSLFNSCLTPNPKNDSFFSRDLFTNNLNSDFYYILAENEVNKESFNKAYTLYEKAYSLNPQKIIAEKKMTLGSSFLDKKKFLAKSKYYSLLYPQSIILQKLLAKSYTENNMQTKAFNEYQRIILKKPEDLESLINVINYYLEHNEYKKGYDLLNKKEMLFSESFEFWLLRSIVELSLQKHDFALLSAQKAYHLNNSSFEAKNLLSLTFILNNKLKSAENILVQNKEDFLISFLYKGYFLDYLNPYSKKQKNNSFFLNQNKIIASKAVSTQFSILDKSKKLDLNEKIFIKALKALYAKKINKTIDYFCQLSTSHKLYIPSKIKTIELLRAKSKPLEALEHLDFFLSSNKFSWKKYILAAQLFSEANKLDKAIEILDQAYKKNSKNIDILFLKAIYQNNNNQKTKSIQTLKKIILLDPLFIEAHNYLAYIFAEKSMNLNLAQNLALHSLNLDPKNPFYLDTLAWVLYKKNLHKESINLLLEAHQLISKDKNSFSKAQSIILSHLNEVYRTFLKNKAQQTFTKKILNTNLVSYNL